MSAVEPLDPGRILELGLAFWSSKTLLSAVELGVFTELAKGPLTAEELRQRIGIHERAARDFFDSLVALRMLERDGDVYSNAAEADAFLDKAKPSYTGGLLEMANNRLYAFWGNLTEGLRTGEPQNEARSDEDFFGILYSDPAKLREFAQAMTAVSMGSALAIAEKFPWQKYKTFMDIGTAQGNVPVQVALKHPHLTGGGTDLSPLEPVTTEYIAANGLSDRLRFQAHDFFAEPFPNADVLIMGHILHDWDLTEKKMLINKAYDALPDGGALIAYDAIIDDDRRENIYGLTMSLNMLIETPGGFDYTGADCRGWMAEIGFSDSYVEPLTGGESMVVGIK
ncbi:methyltransferase [Mycobacterium sp.]|uniref:methyltransferase n=1 Tax=Mycobacterium sp. TaxID=1785 RepID=UPI002D938508|nr:methyltransferase [Mycobacterium sp.]